MVSAACPNCKILLVEATTNLTIANLGTAVDTAARWARTRSPTATAAASSSTETSSTTSHYKHPGVAITVSSGDERIRRLVPGRVAVRHGRRRHVAHASGERARLDRERLERRRQRLLAYEAKPPGRPTPAARGARSPTSPRSRIPTPASRSRQLRPGRLVTVFGGTSASSPIVASVYALAGNAASVNYGSYPYSHTSVLFDVTAGSNGTCSPSYLCTGVAGYDGPTGLGTPNGVSGF